MKHQALARYALRSALALGSTLLPAVANAESGRFNLHLDLGPSIVVLGELAPAGNNLTLGGVGQLAFDWQVFAPFALEATVGGGYFGRGFPGTANSGQPYFNVALGARFRFLDNQEGYANEPGGDYQGNFWVSGHVGYHLFDSSQLGFDLGAGYEWSIARPLQLGVFARGTALVDFGAGRQHDILAVVGINGSIELGARQEGVDTDHDGLSDEREVQRWQTNPNNPDTDGDGLNDGLEVRTRTQPTNPDTDGDGLRDGQEDANHNGTVEANESDPREADSDHGGVNDGFEVAHPPLNPRNPSDDDADGDRVMADHDACPNTPPNTEVDARGCAILRAELVLDGINFATGQADILPDSETTLQRAAQILRDNPTVRVEISGHTDNVGNAADNLRLSQARATSVRDWLEGHQIPRANMTVRGYGMTRPRGSNDTEEGRAQNRRIEFHRLDGTR
ncbi:MAG: OmpA family protein [Deltaproteobacteria bacterium]|nr:OmpA family protein [Deltaproteobacteria bacterium]